MAVDTDTNADVGNMEVVANVNGEVNGDAPNDNSELVLIQDNAFNVKIHVPNLEPFDLQVTTLELVQELHQMLMDKEETCHRTCFSLQFDGVALDNFSELRNIEGLKDGSVLKLVEEPYTIRDVRLHVRHVNDLIHSIDPLDQYNGTSCNSLTFVNDLTVSEESKQQQQAQQQRSSQSQQQKPDDTPVPEYILPNQKDSLLLPLHLNGIKQRPPTCVKQLTFSGWNPPIGKRKMKGDLMYLHVITCEDKRYHVSASTRGFYVNQSTDDTFNPKAENPKQMYHSLVDLLNTLSPTFKKSFMAIQKKRIQKHPFERIGTPFQVYSWLAPDFEHTVDWFRAEDANASKLGHEDHIPGHSRDWNEELQATKELPKKTLPERLIRERAMFKVHSDFVAAATRGAQAVIDGNIMAINPGEDSKIQMFIWNNMFFSLGFDVKDHYKEFGGDFAAYMAPIYDLQGVKAINSLDIDGLHTLGTIVVDYRGYRVTAQSIIPGILEKDQEQSVVYGSTDFGKTCSTHPKYEELLGKVCQSLKTRPHKIKLENDETITLHSSIECKGIIGNDGRHYILDLLRTFPLDLNYTQTSETQPNDNTSFPRKFRHRLCSLRQELIETFIDTKYIQFVKHAAFNFQEMKKNMSSGDEDKELAEGKKLVKSLTSSETVEATEEQQQKQQQQQEEQKQAETDKNSEEIVRNACKAISSLKANEFDISFNTNLHQPIVKLADEQELLDLDVKLLQEASDFIVQVQIPLLINDLYENALFITDGTNLCEQLHARGINIRYLGYFINQISKHEKLSYIYTIAVNELVSRCCKRVFRIYVQNVTNLNLSQAIALYLNCYLSNTVKLQQKTNGSEASLNLTMQNSLATTPPTTTTSTNGNDVAQTQAPSEVSKNKKKKKNQKKSPQSSSQQDQNEWQQLTPRNLWANIIEEAQLQYHFEITNDSSLEELFSKYKLRKMSLLRSFCQKNGVQLVLREYNFDNKHKELFHEDDILNLYPIVKHVPTKASDAYNFFTNGQSKIQQGYLKEGFELINEAYNLLTNVYGALHPEICMCLRLMARLNYILGDFAEAMSTQHKAVLMCERLSGVDHSQIISEYTNLALYAFANGQVQNALRYLYRARYLLLLLNGEDHPEMSLIDSNLGLVLQAASDYESALKFLEKSLELNKKYFGEKSMKVAVSNHLIALLQSCRGDFRAALMNERETYQIYRALLGENHERTQESAQVLRHFTEQAVLLQKRLNEFKKGEKSTFPQIQIQQPSMQTILQMLNVLNGIVYLQTKDDEVETMRDELNKLKTLADSKKQLQLQQQEVNNNNTTTATEQPIINSQDDDLQ